MPLEQEMLGIYFALKAIAWESFTFQKEKISRHHFPLFEH